MGVLRLQPQSGVDPPQEWIREGSARTPCTLHPCIWRGGAEA